MKLSSRYSRVNLFTSLIILLVTAIAYYLVIHFILTEQLDKDLAVEEQEIAAYAARYGSLPPESNFRDQIVRYRHDGRDLARRFSDTEYDNLKDHEKEPGRSLFTLVSLNGRLVGVEIIKSKVESEDLIRVIFLITVSIIVLLLASLGLVNRFMLNRLWKPFHMTLARLRDFKIADDEEMRPEDTRIDEFVAFNKVAVALTMRVRKDYRDLKSITDNAAHEMMTPVAVIHSKLDTLLQTGTFSAEQGVLLDDVYKGVSRLSRLNHSLLLLSKLENHLIVDKDPLSLKELVSQKSRQFRELLQAENIAISCNLDEKDVVMSKYLADILLNNLFSNAIRHNRKGGEIAIRLTGERLEVCNTGRSEPLVSEEIFERFHKNTASEGMGLGLAISREICNYSGSVLSYRFRDGKHCFAIDFH
jgi:signal transduction histidine kinase